MPAPRMTTGSAQRTTHSLTTATSIAMVLGLARALEVRAIAQEMACMRRRAQRTHPVAYPESRVKRDERMLDLRVELGQLRLQQAKASRRHSANTKKYIGAVSSGTHLEPPDPPI